METFQDKDVFLVKLPNKLKDLLKNPEVFSLYGHDDELIGVITQEEVDVTDNTNPECDDLSSMYGIRRGFRAKCKLDVPIKRQKITETQSLFFDLTFPTVKP